ncbi:MAG: LLM class flavin-dependent oxidoreductase [Myxococcota bacterium]
MLTCTFAPTVLAGPRVVGGGRAGQNPMEGLEGDALLERTLEPVRQAEALGVDYLLVAQRWWGSGEETEGSSYDCLAMTSLYAAHTRRIRLITAIHPGFFLPGPIAKWGATLDRLTGGRWSINITSGWNLDEFGMYGAELLEHDERYARSAEFIEVLRGAWSQRGFSYRGRFYRVDDLKLDPPPRGQLEVFQGGQSDAAVEMASSHADWMFLNGGPPGKIGPLIERARKRAEDRGRRLCFALYGIPHCRASDAEAEAEVEAMAAAVDDELLARRRRKVVGAEGMWREKDDRLAMLDSNEGFASRLIGSPATILERMREFHALGVDCFLVLLHDERFNREVLPALREF